MLNLMQEVSRLIGVGLSKLLGWRIDLKNPELEVGAFFSPILNFDLHVSALLSEIFSAFFSG